MVLQKQVVVLSIYFIERYIYFQIKYSSVIPDQILNRCQVDRITHKNNNGILILPNISWKNLKNTTEDNILVTWDCYEDQVFCLSIVWWPKLEEKKRHKLNYRNCRGICLEITTARRICSSFREDDLRRGGEITRNVHSHNAHKI